MRTPNLESRHMSEEAHMGYLQQSLAYSASGYLRMECARWFTSVGIVCHGGAPKRDAVTILLKEVLC